MPLENGDIVFLVLTMMLLLFRAGIVYCVVGQDTGQRVYSRASSWVGLDLSVRLRWRLPK